VINTRARTRASVQARDDSPRGFLAAEDNFCAGHRARRPISASRYPARGDPSRAASNTQPQPRLAIIHRLSRL